MFNQNNNQIWYFFLMFLTYLVVSSVITGCVENPVKPGSYYYQLPGQKKV